MTKIPIMVTGLSPVEDEGDMAKAVAKAVIADPELNLVNISLTGDVGGGGIMIDESPVEIYRPAQHEYALKKANGENPGLKVIDASIPDAYLRNGLLYVSNKIPHIMMTTTPKTDEGKLYTPKLIEAVENAGILSAGSSNWGLQLLGLLAGLKNTASDAFKGYVIESEEDHQWMKKDPSGTERTWRELFIKKGAGEGSNVINFRVDPRRHGYHTYQLSKEGNDMENATNILTSIFQYIKDECPNLFTNDWGVDIIYSNNGTEEGSKNVADIVNEVASDGIPGPQINIKEKKGVKYEGVFAEFKLMNGTTRIQASANYANGKTTIGFKTLVDGVSLYTGGVIKAAKMIDAEGTKGLEGKFLGGDDVLAYKFKK